MTHSVQFVPSGIVRTEDTVSFDRAHGDTLADEISRVHQNAPISRTVAAGGSFSADVPIGLYDSGNSQEADVGADVPMDVVLDDGVAGSESVSYSASGRETAPEIPTKSQFVVRDMSGTVASIPRDHRRIEVPRTLRERRLRYVCEMHELINKSPPRLPKAVLYKSPSMPARSKWEIECGIVGAWRQSPTRKAPEYAAYGGSVNDFLNAKRWDLCVLKLEREAKKRQAQQAQQPPAVIMTTNEMVEAACAEVDGKLVL